MNKTEAIKAMMNGEKIQCGIGYLSYNQYADFVLDGKKWNLNQMAYDSDWEIYKEPEKPKPSLMNSIHSEQFSTSQKVDMIMELFKTRIKTVNQAGRKYMTEREYHLVSSIIKVLSGDPS